MHCRVCGKRRPFTGYSLATRTCGACQQRGDPEPLIAALREHFDLLPQRLLRALLAWQASLDRPGLVAGTADIS
ncbi:MAG TPA: hypothetical protein VHZ24_00545 [Pirellulales bacterium]|nr:hypothetical protein [Pirellulales bacterium]